MTSPLTPKAKQALAWLGLGGLVLAMALPLAGFSWSLSQNAQRLELSNTKLEALVARRGNLEAQLTALQSDPDSAAFLVPGVSSAVASAAVQERIRLIAEAAGGSLDSARVRPAEQLNGFEKIAMTVRVTTDSDGLARMLSEFEYGRPVIMVDKLAIRANRNLRRLSTEEPTVGTDLIATIDISAWRRP